MLILFVLSLFAMTSPQNRPIPPDFVVERVELHGTYDSTYVLTLANIILAPNKQVSESDVRCLLDEVKASGLFRDLTYKWDNNSGGVRRLSLWSQSRFDRKSVRISKFTLEGFPDVNYDEFLRKIGERGLTSGMLLSEVAYDRLSDTITETITKLVPEAVARKYEGSAWILFRADSDSVEVRVVHDLRFCH